jgi:hypothetical protein
MPASATSLVRMLTIFHWARETEAGRCPDVLDR